MKHCKECGKDNRDAATYCQGCGTMLRKRGMPMVFGGALASFASGFSLAPLVAMSVDNGAGDTVIRERRATSVPVEPLRDGSWFCPDCGFRNRRFSSYCAGCERDAM